MSESDPPGPTRAKQIGMAQVMPWAAIIFAAAVAYASSSATTRDLERHVALPAHADATRRFDLHEARIVILEASRVDTKADILEMEKRRAADLLKVQESQALIIRRLDAICFGLGKQCTQGVQ